MRRPTKNMKGTNYVKNGGLKSFRAPGGGVMMKSQVLDQDDNDGEYDNEYDNEEDDEDDEQGEDFYSQQDYEVHAFVFDPLKVELEDYLKVDDYFHYKYTNPKIKVARSLSVNQAVEYEMTEDEVEAIRMQQ